MGISFLSSQKSVSHVMVSWTMNLLMYCILPKNPRIFFSVLVDFIPTITLILRVHSGFILLNFCLISFMVGSVGMQCCTIFVSIPGMSSYDLANTSLNFVSRATNASFLEEVKVLLSCIILGSSSVPNLTGWVSSFIGSTCPYFNSLLLRVFSPISEIKTFNAKNKKN